MLTDKSWHTIEPSCIFFLFFFLFLSSFFIFDSYLLRYSESYGRGFFYRQRSWKNRSVKRQKCKRVHASCRAIPHVAKKGNGEGEGLARLKSRRGLAARGRASRMVPPIELARAFTRLTLFFKHASFFICSRPPLFQVPPAALRAALLFRANSSPGTTWSECSLVIQAGRGADVSLRVLTME